MWPHWAQRRRWNHQPPAASHSTQPVPLGGTHGSIPDAVMPAPFGSSDGSAASRGVARVGVRRRSAEGAPGSGCRRARTPPARSPWCLLTTIRQEMSRPSPVPSPTGLVVKNGSKMRLADLRRHPGPGVAELDEQLVAVSSAVRTVSVPCAAPSRRPRCRSGSSTPG